MITQLTIQNLGLIDHLSLDLGKGLNIFTGETGAGKSIIIDGLRFALGERLNTDHIRDTAKVCSVEVVFDLVNTDLKVNPIFHEFFTDENILIILRQYWPDSRSKIKINGQTVTVTQLKMLGDHLIDFHGAHDHQQLLSESTHLGLLDRLIASRKPFDQFGELFIRYETIKKQINELRVLSASRDRDLDFLAHQIKDLEQVPLSDEKYTQLLQDFQRINNGEKLYASASEVYALLSEGENQISELIRQVFGPLRTLGQLDEKASCFLDLAVKLQENADELSSLLREYLEKLNFAPDYAASINSQFDIYENIRRKYGPNLADARKYYAEAKQRYGLLLNFEHNQEELESELAQLDQQLSHLASELSRIRKITADSLKKTIEQELKELGIAQVQFEARVIKDHYHPLGWDKVVFYISPNTGEDLKPLSIIVSSGEAARVMLAMKKALIKVDPIPVLIFDEIDAQIGGRLGSIIGRKLQEIAASRQVILITHLPQIASFANKHYKVIKEIRDQRTYTTAMALDEDGRIQELSQMLNGEQKNKIAISHAKDMLEQAQKV